MGGHPMGLYVLIQLRIELAKPQTHNLSPEFLDGFSCGTTEARAVSILLNFLYFSGPEILTGKTKVS